MKWTSLTFAGLVGVATACVVDDLNPTCPTRTISNIVADFDDRKDGIKLTHYHHLNFNDLTVEHQGSGDHHRGVIPHSEPHYGVGYDSTEWGQGPLLSIDGTNTTSFDFNSAWVGCISASNTKSGYEAVTCKFTVDCVSTLSFEGHFGPQIYDYVPSGPEGAEMMLVEPNFTYCQQSPIEIWEAPESVIIVVDDINYTIRQGECLPLFQGDTNPSC